MADAPAWYSPGYKAPAVARKPSESLWTVEKGSRRVTCELRDHGPYGVEAQFFDPVDLVIAHTFQDVNDGQRNIPARELAIAWAEQERKAIEQIVAIEWT